MLSFVTKNRVWLRERRKKTKVLSWHYRTIEEASSEVRENVREKRKDKVRAACLHPFLSVSCWPGLPGASLFLSSFNLEAGTAVQTQPISTISAFSHLIYPAACELAPNSHPHPGSKTWFPQQQQLPLPLYPQQQQDKITKLFLSSSSENNIVCDANELWGMTSRNAVAIVCMSDDRGGRTAGISWGVEEKKPDHKKLFMFKIRCKRIRQLTWKM